MSLTYSCHAAISPPRSTLRPRLSGTALSHSFSSSVLRFSATSRPASVDGGEVSSSILSLLITLFSFPALQMAKTQQATDSLSVLPHALSRNSDNESRHRSHLANLRNYHRSAPKSSDAMVRGGWGNRLSHAGAKLFGSSRWAMRTSPASQNNHDSADDTKPSRETSAASSSDHINTYASHPSSWVLWAR